MNKKSLLLTLVAIPAMLSCNLVNGGGTDTATGDTTVMNTTTADNANEADDTTTVEDPLLKSVLDYNMDLEGLSYGDLYLLLNYPYAKHAFWFREEYLNKRYSQVKWYKKLIEKRYFHEEQYDNWKGEKVSYQALNEDTGVDWAKWSDVNRYESLKKSTPLTSEEKAFQERVAARMAELEKDKYVKIGDDIELYNPSLAISDSINSDLLPLLQKNGFAIEQSNYTQLFQVYEENDYNAIPNYITTDLMLQLYSLYNRHVMDCMESCVYGPAIEKMCEGMYKASVAVSDTTTDSKIKSMADFSAAYFAIGLSLYNGKTYKVPASVQDKYKTELANIKAQEDKISPLLDTEVNFMYSMFKPRAQYTRSAEASRYFRAMMWLQTAYLCPTTEGIRQSLFISKLNSMCDKSVKDASKSITRSLDHFVGEPNNIPMFELYDLYCKIAKPGSGFEELANDNMMELATNAIVETQKDKNSIKPKVMISCDPKINLMPQRYVPDGEVLSFMADEKANSERAYPRGVDVFDAFGVKAAIALNDTFFADNKKWNEYPVWRKKARDKFCGFDKWNRNACNKWLQMLMELQKTDKSYPGFMKTSAWELKNLNTSLASWAELKHNTLLYAVQPTLAECGDGGDEGLPEPTRLGFVEPNLKFWKTMKEAINQTYEIAKESGFDVTNKHGKSNNTLSSLTESLLKDIDFLIKISEKELRGEKLTTQDYETIRLFGSNVEYQTVALLVKYNEFDSWLSVADVDKKMPVVADVFTRNIYGCQKSGVLHEGVGNANTIYVIVEIEGKFYLTRGATFSYYEFVTPGTRLTDEEWQKMISNGQAPNLQDWFVPLMTKKPIKRKDVDYLYSSGC